MRAIVRDTLVFLAAVLTAPLWIPVRLALAIGVCSDLFLTCSQLLSLAPGVVGVFLRRGFCWMCLEAFARDCSIGFGTWLAHPQVRIGSGVYIGGRCTLGMVDIGDNVLIGSNVDILSGRHQHDFSDSERPVSEQGGTFHRTRIGSDSWVGNSSVIMANVGEHSVIGAGAVVVRPVPPWSIAVGNPARVVGNRIKANAINQASRTSLRPSLSPAE